MDGRTFYSNIQAHETLNWLGAKQGATPAEDIVIIGNARFCTKFAIPVASLSSTPWDQLEAVLLHQRGPQVMTHVTRIVGYYSQLQNWNASKLAELKDRHRGSYSVPEVPKSLSASAAA